jgi:hypothetical protein
MPRSAPGPAMGLPSSTMLPLVGVSSPATMRSRVDLPQPEGPRMVMKSFSATLRSVACSATVPGPLLAAKVFDSWVTVRIGLVGRSHRPNCAQGKSLRFSALNARSVTRPNTPITMMPKMIWSVASSAWLSVIMWPMPLEAPISSATIT